jgi:FMN-dependent NADH-azoreductase
MATILHLDASVRSENSLSRGLSRAFVKTWLAARPGDTVLRRDVGLSPPPFVTQDWIAAAFTIPEQRSDAMTSVLAASDLYISELERADLIVLGTPMYNYGMPAQLKAWIDQVIRVNRTFSFDLARGDWPLEPILGGKELVLLTSSGEFGFEPGGIREAMNHLDTHIRTCAHYLGAAHVHHIAMSYQEFGDARHNHSIARAQAQMESLTRKLLLSFTA